MTYCPEAVPTGDVAMEPVDTSKAALKCLKPPTSSFDFRTSSFRAWSGVTRGEVQLLQTVSLGYLDMGYAGIGRTKSVDVKDEDYMRPPIPPTHPITHSLTYLPSLLSGQQTPRLPPSDRLP